jgi:thiol-disulfide isomerase/thioredoxin
MKKMFFLLFILGCTLVIKAQQNFEIKPQKPFAGSVIKFELLTRNTSLQGKQDIEGVAYLLEGKMPLAVPITLKKDGGILSGSVKTNDTTKAVFFSFFNNDVFENNNEEGYYTLVYDKNGKEVVGGNVALAQAFNNYGGIWRLKRNADKAAEFNKKEFSNTTAKEKYPAEYLAFLAQSKNEADKELLKQELTRMTDKKDLNEIDLMTIKNHYERTLKDKEKADAVMTMIKERFPNGAWKRNEAVMAFSKEKDAAQKEKLYDDFLKTFAPFSKDDNGVLDNMAYQLAQRFADTADYNSMKKYAAMIRNNSMKAGLYNNIAWKLSGEGVTKKPINVQVGKELSQQSLELLQKEMKEQDNKPTYYTSKQYAKNLESSYHTYADTYATLLYHAGDYDKAYDIEKKAVEHFKRKNITMNEAFTVLTEKTKGKQAARDELEKFFEEGKYTAAMKDQLKAIYLADNKTEEEWVKYSSNLEEMAFNKLKAEIAKKMINLPAPQFSLKDIEGKEVKLSSLKGKVVVLDFWATWCGPCIASFPAMKRAVEKYRSNPDVVFLFVDTWENGDDREKKVTDFINQNKYPFHVLIDPAKTKEGTECVYVEQFKVDGIPTKFVLDRNSNIRFKSVGWSGNADELVNELTAMIDIAAIESGAPLKKAF